MSLYLARIYSKGDPGYHARSTQRWFVNGHSLDLYLEGVDPALGLKAEGLKAEDQKESAAGTCAFRKECLPTSDVAIESISFHS